MAPRVRKTVTPPTEPTDPVADYRFDAARKNIPPAGLAAQGKLAEPRRIRYDYDPHRPPLLRFDASGAADRLPELLAATRRRALTEEEARLLAEALRDRQPWLEWAGKREQRFFEVEPVALHIHERIAAQAIVKVAARQDVQRDLFADPQLSYREAVQFYQHDIDWANRMILGDSLQVMASLARREDVAGRVQMIYVDPPYGIKFASNFQPEVGKRDVKDKESDLTREPEMVKAYRDIWTLGVHSYLAYLRDRLMVAKELLADSGSIFVQISDENLHRLRCVMDEVFGAENFVSLITFRTTANLTGSTLGSNSDYLLLYAKERSRLKYRQLYQERTLADDVGGRYMRAELSDGCRVVIAQEAKTARQLMEEGARIYRHDNLTSQGATSTTTVPYEHNGHVFYPGANRHWTTPLFGLDRLANANRLGAPTENSLAYVRFLEDFPVGEITNVWSDTATGAFTDAKVYVVQTNTKVISRCLLMTTDPGDLVLDPTCGSGTTAYVAEQWGRRWITIDTSRVALALARQRLITAKFDYYQLRPVNEEDLRRNPNGAWLSVGSLTPRSALPSPSGRGVGGEGKWTLDCETVPHITLKSIAQNTALDPIFAKHQPILDEKLAALNAALADTLTPRSALPSPGGRGVGGEGLRAKLAAKLAIKEKTEGKKAITEADRRRWLLPPAHRDPKAKLTVDARFAGWYEWEVPFDADPDWPEALQAALVAYRAAWRAKMDEVNAAIAANADNEELVDKPGIRRNVVRVSGPFTVEAVMPAEQNPHDVSPIESVADELEGFDAAAAPKNAEAFLNRMIRLLAQDGVRFPNNKTATFARLSPIGEEFLHAEGEWSNDDGPPRQVAVTIGPEFGPVTAWQVENALTQAYRRRVYQDLVVAGFSFDAAAQALVQDDPNPQVRCHLAHIRPDVNMGGLLKDTPNAQLFTVFGSPRTRLDQTPDGLFAVTLEGVDIYNPVDNTILATQVDKVAAWFVDSDYDGRAFCITQAFFPDKSAWDKLARALKTVVDESALAALSGTVSLPFAAGKNRRVAVKVIDPRGNEVMRVHRLDEPGKYRSGG